MSWRPRLSLALQELRAVYCPLPESKSAVGLQSFMRHQYGDLAELNPGFPLLDRPMVEAPDGAMLHARYDYGVEETRNVDNMTEEQVAEAVRELVEKGYTMKKSPHESRKPDLDIVDGMRPQKPAWWPVTH